LFDPRPRDLRPARAAAHDKLLARLVPPPRAGRERCGGAQPFGRGGDRRVGFGAERGVGAAVMAGPGAGHLGALGGDFLVTGFGERRDERGAAGGG
jgi:hypothetical protein